MRDVRTCIVYRNWLSRRLLQWQERFVDPNFGLMEGAADLFSTMSLRYKNAVC